MGTVMLGTSTGAAPWDRGHPARTCWPPQGACASSGSARARVPRSGAAGLGGQDARGPRGIGHAVRRQFGSHPPPGGTDMGVSLKPLREQVMVITGASSGIGLCTARMAAANGARVVLAARNGEALADIERQITAAGGQAAHVVADVGKREDVRRIADTAVQRFGGFDTWVNDAGISIWGKLEEVSDEDHKRLFDTNFWGTVYGSQ